MTDSTAGLLLTEFRSFRDQEFRAFREQVTDWQRDMVGRTSTLETQVKSVVGNGQPGRLGVAEDKLDSLRRDRWIISGVLLSASTLIGWAMHLLPWVHK